MGFGISRFIIRVALQCTCQHFAADNQAGKKWWNIWCSVFLSGEEMGPFLSHIFCFILCWDPRIFKGSICKSITVSGYSCACLGATARKPSFQFMFCLAGSFRCVKWCALYKRESNLNSWLRKFCYALIMTRIDWVLDMKLLTFIISVCSENELAVIWQECYKISIAFLI